MCVQRVYCPSKLIIDWKCDGFKRSGIQIIFSLKTRNLNNLFYGVPIYVIHVYEPFLLVSVDLC